MRHHVNSCGDVAVGGVGRRRRRRRGAASNDQYCRPLVRHRVAAGREAGWCRTLGCIRDLSAGATAACATSLRQQAELTKVSNPYLSQIERGLHQPSIGIIKSLAEALNLSARDLLAHAADIASSEEATTTTEGAIRAPLLNDAQKRPPRRLPIHG